MTCDASCRAAGVYDEVAAMKKTCGDAHLKTILAAGDLGSLTNVYKASVVCMMAGEGGGGCGERGGGGRAEQPSWLVSRGRGSLGGTAVGTVTSHQSWGQFRFCNSIPIPIPIKAIPLQFRIRYPIPKTIQFKLQFR